MSRKERSIVGITQQIWNIDLGIGASVHRQYPQKLLMYVVRARSFLDVGIDHCTDEALECRITRRSP
jgi:hypothetical protein